MKRKIIAIMLVATLFLGAETAVFAEEYDPKDDYDGTPHEDEVGWDYDGDGKYDWFKDENGNPKLVEGWAPDLETIKIWMMSDEEASKVVEKKNLEEFYKNAPKSDLPGFWNGEGTYYDLKEDGTTVYIDGRYGYYSFDENKHYMYDKTGIITLADGSKVKLVDRYSEVYVERNTLNQPLTNIKFTDLKESHWAYNSINYLSGNNILSGYSDGTFKPNNKVTRAEFAKILYCLIYEKKFLNGLNLDATPRYYNDTTNWAKEYVAKTATLIPGKGYDTFYPERPLYRRDVANSLAALIVAENPKILFNPAFSNTYKDGDKLTSADVQNVGLVNVLGIMKGYPDNTFRPD